MDDKNSSQSLETMCRIHSPWDIHRAQVLGNRGKPPQIYGKKKKHYLATRVAKMLLDVPELEGWVYSLFWGCFYSFSCTSTLEALFPFYDGLYMQVHLHFHGAPGWKTALSCIILDCIPTPWLLLIPFSTHPNWAAMGIGNVSALSVTMASCQEESLQEGTFPNGPSTPRPIFPALSHHKFHLLSYTRILFFLKPFPNTFWWLDAFSQNHMDCNRKNCGSPWRNRNYGCISLFLSYRIHISFLHIYLSRNVILRWNSCHIYTCVPSSVSQSDKYFQCSIPLSVPWKIQDNEVHRAADGKVLVGAGDGKEGVPWKWNIIYYFHYSSLFLRSSVQGHWKRVQPIKAAEGKVKGKGKWRRKRRGKVKRAPFHDSQETWKKKLERTRKERAGKKDGAPQRLPGLGYEVFKEPLSFSFIPWEKEQWKGQVSPAVASLKESRN